MIPIQATNNLFYLKFYFYLVEETMEKKL